MGFKCGIVGLPNVGKSTLFNALTQTAAAQAANYPFCTIEPNVGDVAVPDPRLETLAKIAELGRDHSHPHHLRGHRRAGARRLQGRRAGQPVPGHTSAKCDAIAHVLRCFEDDDITHVEGRIDPIGDAETVETELMLADLDSLEKRVKPLEKKANGGEKEAKDSCALMTKALDAAARGQAGARWPSCRREERGPYRQLGLMTAKPVLYVCNVDEGVGRHRQRHSRSKSKSKRARARRQRVVISAADRGRDRATADRANAPDFLETHRPGRARPQPHDPRRL